MNKSHMNKYNLLIACLLIAAAGLGCTFLKEKLGPGGKPATAFDRAAGMPRPNPDAPLVSPAAVAIRRLAEIDPSVAELASGIEAAERGAMKQTIDELRPNGENSFIPNSTVPDVAGPASTSQTTSPAAMMFQAGDAPLPGIWDGVVVGMLTGMFKGMLTEVEAGNFKKKASKTDTSDGTTSIMEVEFGGSEDGSTSTDLSLKTESTKNGVKVTTEMQAKIEGFECPNAEGQVPITVKMRLSARKGTSGYTQDVTAFIRVIVGEDAEVATGTVDITQATSRGLSGGETFVETGETLKFKGVWKEAVQSNEHVSQKTDNAGDADIYAAMESGNAVAYGAAIGAIETAKLTWQGGKCVKLDAKSPGRVEPNSSHQIPVKVIHKKEGTDVPSKVDAVLSGAASVTPNVIPKTAGTLTYVAPPGAGMQATIKLTANSRRGRATLELTASTGSNSYHIVGGLDDFQTSADVCDVTKPFTLTGGGFTVEFSGGMEGTYTYTGPYNAKGDGSYQISLPDGPAKPGTMTGGGAGQITGGGKVYTGSGMEKYTLTPIPPCS